MTSNEDSARNQYLHARAAARKRKQRESKAEVDELEDPNRRQRHESATRISALRSQEKHPSEDVNSQYSAYNNFNH